MYPVPATMPKQKKIDPDDYPPYKVDHRLVYDPTIDDVLVKRWLPLGDDESIADRVGRTTFAHSTRGFPRKPPSVDRIRIAVLKDPHPTFQVYIRIERLQFGRDFLRWAMLKIRDSTKS